MQRFKNILCVISPGSSNDMALARATALAQSNQAQLTVVDVIDEIPANTKLLERLLSPENIQKSVVDEHQAQLNLIAATGKTGISIQTKLLVGIPFLEIIRQVLRHHYDLVIKTTDSSDFLDRLFGSDDMHLLRKCPCPVWLLRSESSEKYHRIVVAIDVSDEYPSETLHTRYQLNLQLLKMAGSLALSEFSELHIVHAWEAIAEHSLRRAFIDISEEKITAYVDEVRQQHKHNLDMLVTEMMDTLDPDTRDYLQPKIHLLKGSPRKEIPVFAKEADADLVIMGTVARTGIPGLFMGNTAETILNRLDCSVLAIKPPGFITPVTLA